MATAHSIEQTRVHLRWMIRRDLPEVLEIEDGSYDYPWQEESFLHCLRQRNCIGMVAEQDGKVAGFMIYELHKSKLQVLNLAVHPDFRRQGIGTKMVDKLKSKLTQQRRSRIVLEVRETALEAQLFLQSQGFRAVGVMREYFEEDSGEDAFVMRFQKPLVQPSMTVA